MSKKISGAEYPLAKIFSSDFDYSIPSYQRPYAWTEVQAGDLFSDLYDFFIKEKDDTYFLGSIVLIKDEGKPISLYTTPGTIESKQNLKETDGLGRNRI